MTAPPLSALQIRTFLLCALIVLLDGYDLQAMGLAVPALATQWHLAPSAFTLAQSASLLGLGLGSAFIAPLGDRLGRKPLLLGGLAIILVTSLGAATAANPAQLAVWRLLVGLGLGIGQSNASALTAEYAPLARRATLMTLMGVCVALGGVLAGLTAPQVIGTAGAQGLFLVGAALPLLALLATAAGLRESPAIVTKQAAASGGGLPALLRPPYRERTLRLWLVYGLSAMLLYFLFSWLPVFLINAGWSPSRASHGIALLQFGGIAGSLVQAWLVDRRRTITALVGGYATTLVTALLFAIPGSTAAWPVLLVLMGSGVAGVVMSIIALAAIFYPPEIRATGFGWAGAITRVGAVLGPLAGGWIIAAGVSSRTTLGLIAVPALLCIAATLAMRRTVSAAQTAWR
ncbi:MAG TPA: MFS transporter [Steroidobacteraceae bacterium]|jgi:AAHS family 4-hydroxybenzoate transporter-like MFS transporter|nr:MFS transporter [Steroidobacteraceae bacterium]